jgi:hypothetical protein
MIGLDERGNPSDADLHLAWAAGAQAVRLTPAVITTRTSRSESRHQPANAN